MDKQVSHILESLANTSLEEVPTSTTYTESPVENDLSLRPGFNVSINIYDFINLLSENDIVFYTFRVIGKNFSEAQNMIDIGMQGSNYIDYNRELDLGLYIYLGQTTDDVYETLTDLYHNLGMDNIPDSFILIKTLSDTTYNNIFNIFGDEGKISYGSISNFMFGGYWLIVDIDLVEDIMSQINIDNLDITF